MIKLKHSWCIVYNPINLTHPLSLSLSLSVSSQHIFIITGSPLILLIAHYHLHLWFRPRKRTNHPQHPTNSTHTSKPTGQSGCGRNTHGPISRNTTKEWVHLTNSLQQWSRSVSNTLQTLSGIFTKMLKQ